MNLSIKEIEMNFENAFTEVIEDLRSSPLEIPVERLDLNSASEIEIIPTEGKKKKIVKRKRPELNLGEYIVPIPSSMTNGTQINEKQINNLLVKEAKKIRNELTKSNMATRELLKNAIEDDENDSVSSEDTISVNPDIPEKFTERQVIEYPEETNDPIKFPIDKFYLDMQATSFCCKYRIKIRAQPIYQNQKDAAKKICETFSNKQKVIQLLISRTQTGKTGCMIEFIYQYIQKFPIPLENIFIITPLSSTDWLNQTKLRFPEDIEKRIYHLPELLTKFKDDVDGKQNVLIIIDEAHCASLKKQTIQKLMCEDGLNWNLDTILENDIKIVQFSATPDGLIYGLMKREWPEQHYQVHLMNECEGYYGIRQMLTRTDKVVLKQAKDLNGRNKFGEWINDSKEEEVEENINELFGDMVAYGEPKYCIIRGHGSNFDNVKENIMRTADKYLRSSGQYDLFDWGLMEYIQDGNVECINDLLVVKPKKHTIILIKEKLKCSNTIIKKHIGVVYERLAKSVMDSFIIQGLLGRITGYERHDIICYTNIESLEKYEELFKENFSKEILKKIHWNSNSTRVNKQGTKGKDTYVDPKYVLNEQEEEIETNNRISWCQPFETVEKAKEWCLDPINRCKTKTSSEFKLYNSENKPYGKKPIHDLNNVYIKYRGLRKVVSEIETRAASDLFWGVKTTSRIYPVIKNGKIMYLVLYELSEE